MQQLNFKFSISAGQYNAIQQAWKKNAMSGHISAFHHLLYNLLRNKPADYGFCKTTNPNRVSQFDIAMSYLHYLRSCVKIHINRCGRGMRSSDADIRHALLPFEGTVVPVMLLDLIEGV